MKQYLSTVLFNLLAIVILPLLAGFDSIYLFIGYIGLASLFEVPYDAFMGEKRFPIKYVFWSLFTINAAWNYILMTIVSAVIMAFSYSVASIFIILLVLALISFLERLIDKLIERYADA